MALSDWLPSWVLWRYIGGLCGAGGMLLGSGLILGWLMRHGHRPELGVHFMGIGLGIIVTAAGATVLTRMWQEWQMHWLAFALIGLLFFFLLGAGVRQFLRVKPMRKQRIHRPEPPSAGCGRWC